MPSEEKDTQILILYFHSAVKIHQSLHLCDLEILLVGYSAQLFGCLLSEASENTNQIISVKIFTFKPNCSKILIIRRIGWHGNRG